MNASSPDQPYSISIRNKLILSVTLVHLVLMGFFVGDTFFRQREFLLHEDRSSALNFASLMAENVLSWVLAEDLMGMDEVLQASAQLTKAGYACVIDTSGQVLAHTEKSRVGSFLNDAESVALLRSSKLEAHIWRSAPSCTHAAAPLITQNNHVGWVLVGMDLQGTASYLRSLRDKGILYTLGAMLIGGFTAVLLSRLIFRQLDAIMEGISRLYSDTFLPISVFSGDELGHMAKALNQASAYLQTSRSELKREVAERMEAEKQIRYLTRRLVDGNEEERKRLGHDLHDEFGQSVTGLLFGLHSLKTMLKREDAEALDLCEQMIDQAKSFGDSIRRTAAGQFPVVLERLGLATEAPALLGEMAERHSGIQLIYTVDLPERRLHQRIEVTCYRILQEGLSNIVRHSKATEARIELSVRDDRVYLYLGDNGRGFDAESLLDQTHEYSGIGLLGMRARVLAVEGDMKVVSRPGEGCVIIVFLPLLYRDTKN